MDHINDLVTINVDDIPCTLSGPNAASIQATPYDPELERGHYHRPRWLHREGELCWWSLEFHEREIEFPTGLLRFTDQMAAFITSFRLIDLLVTHGLTPRAHSRQAMVPTNDSRCVTNLCKQENNMHRGETFLTYK